MIKFDRIPEIDVAIQRKLEGYAIAIRPKRWEGRAKAVLEFKKEILEQGLTIQSGKCAWCTLAVGAAGRRTAHRDHIAPKWKYPQWTFSPLNLIIACEYCNGFAVKGEIDTIKTVSDVYEECDFYVVHPYLDEPSRHLTFISESDGIRIAIKSLSNKGVWTVEKLQLDTPGATQERAKEHLYQVRMADLSVQNQTLLRDAVQALG